VSNPRQFLYSYTLPEKERNAVQAYLFEGHVIIERMVTRENGRMVHIPDGIVHHWLAIGFIPGVTRDQAIAVAQNYARHAKLYAPDVQCAEILSREDQSFEVYYRFYRHALVTVVYNARFTADFFTLDASRGYSFARSTRIAEVENPVRAMRENSPSGTTMATCGGSISTRDISKETMACTFRSSFWA
jgi:hypothetical protein